MTYATAHGHLLVLAALHGAGAVAVVAMHVQIVLITEATIPLGDAHFAGTLIVFDVFYGNKSPGS